jgi:hypothetical protein
VTVSFDELVIHVRLISYAASFQLREVLHVVIQIVEVVEGVAEGAHHFRRKLCFVNRDFNGLSYVDLLSDHPRLPHLPNLQARELSLLLDLFPDVPKRVDRD